MLDLYNQESTLVRDLQNDIVKEMLEIASTMSYADSSSAQSIMEFLSRIEKIDDTYVKRCIYFFSRSLLRRLDKCSSLGNLYDSSLNMIDAFGYLYENTPFIKFGHNWVNTSIEKYAAGQQNIAVIDIGFGAGIQWIEFLKNTRKRVILFGVDIPQNHTDLMFERFKHSVEANNLQNKIEFYPIKSYVEDLVFSDLKVKGSFNIVNCALSLHHIPVIKNGSTIRMDVLSRICAAGPDLFTLIEPDSNHATECFEECLIEATAHYLSVFSAINHYVKDNSVAKHLETLFFSREIEDIVSNPFSLRAEQHERYRQWQLRLIESGFSELEKESLMHEQKSLLVASCWRSR